MWKDDGRAAIFIAAVSAARLQAFLLHFNSNGSEIINVTYNSYNGNVTCISSVKNRNMRYVQKYIKIFLSKTICGYLYDFDDASIRALVSGEN